MKLPRNRIAICLLAAAGIGAACSSSSRLNTTRNTLANNPLGQSPQFGTVAGSLVIGDGVSIYSLNWTISNHTNSFFGTVNIGDAAITGSVEFVAGGILALNDYVLTISGWDSNNDPCTGSSDTFTVAAGASVTVGLQIVCTVPTDAATATQVDTGGIQVDGGISFTDQPPYQCPAINSVSIDPALVAMGATAALSTTQIGGAAPAAPGTWTWHTSGGGVFFPSPNDNNVSSNVRFQCQTAGTFTITAELDSNVVRLSQDAATDVCEGVPGTTLSAQINCASSGGGLLCFAPTPTVCTNSADGGQYCADLTGSDPNNCGACGNVCAPGFTCGSVDGGIGCNPPPPVPCTGGTAGNNTPIGCVPCTGNTTGVCTPTEQLIVTRDIGKGNISGTTLTAGSCYSCFLTVGCIDSTNAATLHSGFECGDLTGTVGAGAQAAETKTNACLNTLACILGDAPQGGYSWTDSFVSCANASDTVTNCYCGSAFPTIAACNAASGTTVNGNCVSPELDGLGDTTATAPPTVLGAFTNLPTGSGMANAILNCAAPTNSFPPLCQQCLH